MAAPGAVAADAFFENFATEDAFAAWEHIDVNNDGSTWTYDNTAEKYKVYYNYSSANDGDDWLISPEITVSKSGSYVLALNIKGSSFGEAFEIWTGNGRDVKSMTSKIAYYTGVNDSDQSKSVLIDLAEGTKLNVGIHAVTPADRWRLYIADISLRYVENPADPAIVSIDSPISGEGLANEPVTVTIANKGKSAVSSLNLSYTLTSKDMEPVTVNETATFAEALAPGKTTVYTFNTPVNLSEPRRIYTLTVSVDSPDDIDMSNNTATAEVRHMAAATVPYFMGFESDEDTNSLTFLNRNNDSGAWHIAYDSFFAHFSRTGSACLGYNYDSENPADDWAFLDPFSLDAGYYALKFWYSATENHPERLRVCYGTEPTPEAMRNVLCEFNPVENVNYLESISIFDIATAGRYYIGFYAYSDANENWLLVDDISLEKIDPEIADIEIMAFDKPFDFWREPNSTDAAVTVRNVGIVDVTANVIFSIDGREVKRQAETIIGSQKRDIVIPEAVSGLAAGTYTLKVSVEYPDDSNQANNTMEKTLTVLPAPVAVWDFEDGRLPEEFTYRAEDSNTVHPNAGEEFVPEGNGWGIFRLSHPMLGQYAMAGCSYFSTPGTADRWVVLPRFDVKGDNAWLAWDSNSYTMPEDYRVKVSDGEDKWSHYNTEMSVDAAPQSPETRGISLAKYNGKTVYIAFNLVTNDGEALILDNIALYGNVERHNAGVGSVTADSDATVTVTGDMISVSSAATVRSISVYDMRGTLMLRAEGPEACIGNLATGLYIVKADTDNGTLTLKFNK